MGEPDAFQQRQELIAAATGGDPDAQTRLGDVSRVGDEHTQQDFSEALRWYHLPAEQGYRNAQNNIGAIYQHGMGVPRLLQEADQGGHLTYRTPSVSERRSAGRACRSSVMTGIETSVVWYEGHLTVLKIDHDGKRLGAWALVDGKWVEGNPDAFFVGELLDEPVPDSPPLPPW